MLFSDPFHGDPDSASTNMQLEIIKVQKNSELK